MIQIWQVPTECGPSNLVVLDLYRPPQQQHHLQHQPPPSLAQPKKTLTIIKIPYGEYRRLRQEQERRLNPQQPQQPQMDGQPPQGQGGPPAGIQQPVVKKQRDPRRQPKQVRVVFFSFLRKLNLFHFYRW